MIALHYPPAADAAAIRARNLVRNLQALGHEVRVVTARGRVEGEPPPETRALPWLDVEDLARRAIRRRPGSAAALAPARPWQRRLRSLAADLLIPDLYATWIPIAVVATRHAVRASDLLISTGGASAHLVARFIRGSRPAIVDINDLWWRNPRRNSGAFRDRIDHYLEQHIICSATAVVVPVREQGLEVARRWGRSATTVLTGFDPADFEAPSTNGGGPSRRELVFAGTLYEKFRLDLLFEALERGRADRGWTPEQVRVTFIGSGAGTALEAARAHGVPEFVDGSPPIAREDLLKRLVAADALLLPLYGEDPHHLPMRFFDFVGAGRPILGVGSATAAAAQLVQEHRLGVVRETAAGLADAIDDIVSGPRPPDLPPEKRSLFEAANARPTLQRLIDEAATADARTTRDVST